MPLASKVSNVLAYFTAPAPMRDFDDFWLDRGDVGIVQERWKRAAVVIPDGASVLDFGSGTGEFLSYLKSVHPNVKLTGCDNDPVAVSKIKERGFEAFQLDFDREDLPGTYDYVTAFEVLEHIPEAEAALLKLARSSKRQIIISVPNVGYWKNRVRLLAGRFPTTNVTFHIKEHLRHWTRQDFIEWADRLGFEVVQVSGQYVSRGLQQRWPGVFSAGLVFVLEPKVS